MDAIDATIEAAAAPIPTRPGRATPGQALSAFAIDAAIALVALFGISFACSALWGAWRGMVLARAGGQADAAHIGQPGGTVIVAIAVVATASAALIVYFWRRRASADERARSAHQARQAATWVWAAMIGLGTFMFNIVTLSLAAQVGLRPVPTNISLLQDTIAHRAWLLWLVAVVLAPAYEELLFRRALFGRLWAAGRPWLGAVLSAMLFALLHEWPGQGGNGLGATAMLWLSYGVMGFAFAWVYRRTGTLWAAIGAHSLNNLLALALMSLST